MKRCSLWACLILLVISTAGSSALAFQQYYDISEHDKAQAEARQRNLPLAWLGSYPEDLNEGTPRPGGTADLTQMAMAALQDKVVIIFFDGRNMAPVPGIIHAEFHKHDDGAQPNNVDWISPKVVFSNPEVTTILGRVSFTQMKSDREAAINTALQIIRNTPDALAPPPPSPPPPSAQDSATTPAPASEKSDNAMDAVSAGFSVLDWLSDYGLYLVVGGVIALVGLFIWLGRSQRS